MRSDILAAIWERLFKNYRIEVYAKLMSLAAWRRGFASLAASDGKAAVSPMPDLGLAKQRKQIKHIRNRKRE